MMCQLSCRAVNQSLPVRGLLLLEVFLKPLTIAA